MNDNCLFVSIQGNYNYLELSLFSGDVCIQVMREHDQRSSSLLVPSLAYLLAEHEKQLSDLAFIAVDKGPGAFTSLRVIIATLNGIAFTQQVKLIGVNGLEALYTQVHANLSNEQRPDAIVCLLNAYSNDVYFYVKKIDDTVNHAREGCQNIRQLLDDDALKNFSSILFTGNGSELHEKLIRDKFGDRAIIEQPLQVGASTHYLGKMAHYAWHEQKNVEYCIMPHYLKTQCFSIKR